MAVESIKKSVTKPKVSAATKATSRGRPKRKALVAMYQSQLSENTMGIKIRLKKSLETPISMALNNAGATIKKRSVPSMVGSAGAASTASTSKSSRKKQRKSKHKDTSDSDDSDYERRRKNNNVSTEKHRNRKQPTIATDYTEPNEQSQWGNVIPEHILLKIFEEAVNLHGTLPTMVNASRVCSLWRKVSLTPKLWQTLDLSTWTKDRSEINLKRIIATHLRWCKDINLGEIA